MIKLPFKTPIRIEDGRFLVTHDCETIIEACEYTDAELEAIVTAVNAYSKQEQALRDIELALRDHPDARRGSSKVHFAYMKALGALQKDPK